MITFNMHRLYPSTHPLTPLILYKHTYLTYSPSAASRTTTSTTTSSNFKSKHSEKMPVIAFKMLSRIILQGVFNRI